MTLSDPIIVLGLLGILQTIIVGLISWDLLTTTRLMNRMTKVETLLEASIVSDVSNLKKRIESLEGTRRINEK